MKTFRIKHEFALQWIDYLLNKGFKQTQEVLHDPSNDTYCCLGVGCVVAKDLGFNVDIVSSEFETEFNGSQDVMPVDIAEFAGITDINGCITLNPQLGSSKASEWNDDHAASFEVIAVLIAFYGEFY